MKDYQTHLQQIQDASEAQDYALLKQAREAFALDYPLTETLWLEWLQDEVSIATSVEEKRALLSLMDKSVSDYLCTLFLSLTP